MKSIMCIHIELIDVIANAFVELLQQNGKREIFLYELNTYGVKTVEVLRQKGYNAVFSVSEDSLLEIFENYGNFFVPFEKNGTLGVRLCEGIDAMRLWQNFCSCLSLTVAKAFQSQNAKEVLRR